MQHINILAWIFCGSLNYIIFLVFCCLFIITFLVCVYVTGVHHYLAYKLHVLK